MLRPEKLTCREEPGPLACMDDMPPAAMSPAPAQRAQHTVSTGAQATGHNVCNHAYHTLLRHRCCRCGCSRSPWEAGQHTSALYTAVTHRKHLQDICMATQLQHTVPQITQPSLVRKLFANTRRGVPAGMTSRARRGLGQLLKKLYFVMQSQRHAHRCSGDRPGSTPKDIHGPHDRAGNQEGEQQPAETERHMDC